MHTMSHTKEQMSCGEAGFLLKMSLSHEGKGRMINEKEDEEMETASSEMEKMLNSVNGFDVIKWKIASNQYSLEKADI